MQQHLDSSECQFQCDLWPLVLGGPYLLDSRQNGLLQLALLVVDFIFIDVLIIRFYHHGS